MSLVEIPASYRADWKGHYAGVRERLASGARFTSASLPAAPPPPTEADRRREIFIALFGRSSYFESPEICKIQYVTTQCFGITISDIRGRSQEAYIAGPRHLAMFLAREQGIAFHWIGRLFNRSASTIKSGIASVERLMEYGDVAGNNIPYIDLVRRLRQEAAEG